MFSPLVLDDTLEFFHIYLLVLIEVILTPEIPGVNLFYESIEVVVVYKSLVQV